VIAVAGCAAGRGRGSVSVTSARRAAAVTESTSARWRIVYRFAEHNVDMTGLTVISKRDAWAVGTMGIRPQKATVPAAGDEGWAVGLTGPVG
jgi:hypothetical protein